MSKKTKMGFYPNEKFFFSEKIALIFHSNILAAIFHTIIFLFAKFDFSFDLKILKILKISQNLKCSVLQRLFFSKSYSIISLNNKGGKKVFPTGLSLFHSLFDRKIAEKIQKHFLVSSPCFFQKNLKYKLVDFYWDKKNPIFIKKKNCAFQNKRVMLKPTKNNNFYFKIHEKGEELTLPIKKKKKKVSELFNFNTSEFSQLKGWFDALGKRIKNFSMLWNQSLWLLYEFYSKNIYKTLVSKIGKEEFFLIIFFCQTNKTDMCLVCNFQKGLKNNLIHSRISTFLFWKTLRLEKIWNGLFSQKKKKILL